MTEEIKIEREAKGEDKIVVIGKKEQNLRTTSAGEGWSAQSVVMTRLIGGWSRRGV